MKTSIILGAVVIVGIGAFFALKELPSGTKAGPKPPPAPPVDVAAVRAKAETGDAAAQAQLGRLYTKGEGVTNSYKEAVAWFRRSADQGNDEGQFGLAEMYDAGHAVKQE